jgi:osmotically-inducible protein OsmY
MKTKIASVCVAWCLASPIVASLAGCDRNRDRTEYERTSGEFVDDKALTGKVKDALKDNTEYKFEEVNVAAFKGTVQLSGFVAASDQKRKAGDIAEKVAGVKKVENNITVKP